MGNGEHHVRMKFVHLFYCLWSNQFWEVTMGWVRVLGEWNNSCM